MTTVKEFLKGLKKDAKYMEIMEKELRGTCIGESSLIFQTSDGKWYKLGFTTPHGTDVVNPFITEWD